MATRKSGPLDPTVGARIRMLRVNRGISQAVLAERIGVSFQQVQRYERGAARAGANRLARIASVLDVSVGEFFESSHAEAPGSTSPVDLLAEPGARQVLEAYARMPSPWDRACIAKLVESIVDRNSRAKSVVLKSLVLKSVVLKPAVFKPTVSRVDTVDPGERRKSPSRS